MTEVKQDIGKLDELIIGVVALKALIGSVDTTVAKLLEDRYLSIDLADKEFSIYSGKEDAALMVGGFIRAKLPFTKKKQFDTDTSLTVYHELDKSNGWKIRIRGYRPSTCKLVTKTVIVPAVKEHLIQASEETTKEVTELVCEEV